LGVTTLKILILDPDSQAGHALVELLQHHPQVEWRGVSAAMLAESAQAAIAIIDDFMPRYIVNAWSIGFSESPQGLPKSHVKTIRNLCRAASASNAVLVHVSSALVFNGARGEFFVESDRPRPKGKVSRRLAELEQTVMRYVDQHIILRSGWLFGAHGRGAFHRFLRGLELGEEIKLPEVVDGAPTPAEDVARVLFAMLQQLDCGASGWGIYHYGSSDVTNCIDFSETVITMAAQYGKIDIEHIRLVEGQGDDAFGMPCHPILECGKILDTFGIKQRPWRSAMTSILKSIYRQQPAEGQVPAI
jgi:dTDP-4-dehydrorhamnose reductase